MKRRNLIPTLIPMIIPMLIATIPLYSQQSKMYKCQRIDGLKAELREIMSLGSLDGEESYILNQPMDVEVGKDGAIYVLDNQKFSISKYDPEGHYLLSMGRKGQGPGELGMCMDFTLDSKNNIILGNLENRRLTRFTPEGQLIGETKLDFTPFNVGVDSQNNVYVYSRFQGKLIHKFDADGKHLLSFMDQRQTNKSRVLSHINQSGRFTIYKDRIYLLLPYPYTIFIFDTQGKELDTFPIKTDYPELPFIGENQTVIVNFSFTGLAVSPSGYLFNKGFYIEVPKDWQSRIQEIAGTLSASSFIDVFTLDSKLVEHLQLPGLWYGGTFDIGGDYYVIKEEEEGFYRIVKYAVLISHTD